MMDEPRPDATPNATSFDFNRPTIVALLYLAGMVTGGITAIIGLVLAYVWTGDRHEPWEATHYTYLIRTFWLGFAASVIGVMLVLVFIGRMLLPIVGAWVLVRTILSLVKAQKRAPIPDPRTFLF